MPKQVALGSVTVIRDGKSVIVNPGETFDFTKDEMADFKALEDRHNDAQKHLGDGSRTPFRAIVRDPVNETPVEEGGAATTTKASAKKAAASDL